LLFSEFSIDSQLRFSIYNFWIKLDELILTINPKLAKLFPSLRPCVK
jgi:hypothetical protein